MAVRSAGKFLADDVGASFDASPPVAQLTQINTLLLVQGFPSTKGVGMPQRHKPVPVRAQEIILTRMCHFLVSCA
jgi:hypothetical protein